MTTANFAVLLGGFFVFVVVIAYILHKLFPWFAFPTSYPEPQIPNTEIKYEPTPDVAVPLPHKPIEWTFANAPEPKRKYTKRSKYWTDKRKKAAARKAKKKTRKSK